MRELTAPQGGSGASDAGAGRRATREVALTTAAAVHAGIVPVSEH